MKLKKIILACLIVFPFFQSNAQIEKEIISFVDSTEYLINNGRKLLLEEVRSYNYTKAHEIYLFLNQKASEKQCDAFTYNEYLLISVLTSDWRSFTEKAKNFKSHQISFCYPSSPIMARELYQEVVKNLPHIQKGIQVAEVSQEEKDLLNLFQYVFQAEKDEKRYNVELKSFQKNYPSSAFTSFVNDYLPKPEKTASMAFAIGASVGFPQGNFKTTFTNGFGIAMDYDICINKVYVSLFMNGTFPRVTTPFYAESEYGVRTDFIMDDKFDYFQGGLKAGYYVVRNNRFHVAPYLAIGGASLTSDIYPYQEDNNEDNNKELKMFNSFFTGPGLHSEVKIYEYKGRTDVPYYYYNYSMPGYVSLKLDAGYNFITNQKHEIIKGNMLYVSLSLVWGIGKF